MAVDAGGGARLTTQELASLQERGYVVLRGVLAAHTLDAVRSALSAVVDRMAQDWLREGLIADLHEDAPFETRWWLIRQQLPALRPVTWRRVLVSEAMYELWRSPELTSRISSVLGPELWAHDTWNGRPREPHAPVQKIDWHQDAFYLPGWEPSDGQVLTCWIPLVLVDERAGCLQVVSGSHLGGRLDAEVDEYRSLRISADRLGPTDVVTVPARPGDVVVFTESTVHQALLNESDYVRWTVDIRFAADSSAMRAKAKGGFLCHTARDQSNLDDYATWAAKYDARDGAMRAQLRLIDLAARRSADMGRDIVTY